MTVSPSCRDTGRLRLGRLLLTTALIGLAPLILPPGAAMAQVYLDNVNQGDNRVNPGDGDWAANDAIWSDEDGDDHGRLATGAWGILAADTANGPADITLNIIGTVQPGILDVRAGNFTLSGGQIGAANRNWTLKIEDGLTLTVGSSLAGRLNLEGQGRLSFGGDGTALQSIDVASGATFDSSGDTAGTMRLAGRGVLSGTHAGSVIVGQGGELDADATINGAITNSGNAVFSGTAGRLLNTGGEFRSDGDLSLFLVDNSDADASFVLGAGDRLTLRQGSFVNGGIARLAGVVDIASGNPAHRVENLSGGKMLLEGATLNGDLVNRANGRIDLQGATVVAGNVANAGDMALAGSGASLDLSGHLFRNNAGGTLATGSGTRIEADEVTLVNGSTMTHAGTLVAPVTAAAGARMTLDAGRVEGTFRNAGRLSGKGSITGTLTNSGDVLVDGALTTGGLANAGTVELDSGDSLTTAGPVRNDGRIEVGGILTLTGTDATLTNAADARLVMEGGTVDGSIANARNGRIEVTRDSTVTGTLANDGRIGMAGLLGTARLTVSGGTFTNTGIIDVALGSRLRIVADRIILGTGSVVTWARVDLVGQILNAGDLIFAEDTVLTGDLVNDRGGESLVLADVDAAGFDVTNAGTMTVRQSPRGTLTDVGTLANTGTFEVETGAVVGAGATRNGLDGSMILAGRMDANLRNDAGGSVALEGGTVKGAVVNAGGLTGTGTIDGTLDNEGLARIAGSARAVANSGTLATAGNLSVDTLVNTGRVEVGTGHRLTAGDTVQNRAALEVAGILDGRIYNADKGTLSLTGGSVTGSVVNTGTMDAAGSTGGVLENRGTLRTTGNLAAGALANSGDATIGASHSLTADRGIANTGTMQVDGTLRGRLENGATLALGGGRIDGAVENAGSLTGSGTITGPVTNSGQIALGGETGDMTNTATGSLRIGGALEVGQLTNAGTAAVGANERLTARDGIGNSGTMDLRGTLRAGGAIVNRTGGVIAADGAAIIGDTVNNGLIDIRSGTSFTGDLTNRGTIDSTGSAEDVLVRVQDGTFRNAGTVQVSGTGYLTIQADDIVLEQTSVVDNTRVFLIGSLANEGELAFRRDAELTGDLLNAPSGTVSVLADVDGGGFNVANRGTFVVGPAGAAGGSLTNVGTLTNSGSFTIDGMAGVAAGSVLNRDGARMVVAGDLTAFFENDGTAVLGSGGGRITGQVVNTGTLRGTGTIAGSLTNRGTASLSGAVGQVENDGTLQTAGDLSTGAIANEGSLTVAEGHVLTAAGTVINNDTMQVAGTLRGAVQNQATLSGNGEITGSVFNAGRLTWTSRIGGTLTTDNRADLAGTVGGDLRNSGRLDTTGNLAVAGVVVNASSGTPATLTVAGGTVLSVAGGITNGAGAVLRNNGDIAGDVGSTGRYVQAGVLNGSLVTGGTADLAGRVTGDVTFAGGSLTLADGLAIGGTLDLRRDFALGAGKTLEAARTAVAQGTEFTLAGRLNGAVSNAGRLAAEGQRARIDGTLANAGVVDLAGDRRPDGRLRTGGLSGNGEYRLDVNLADMTADRITVRGGAATGHYTLVLNQLSGATVGEIGRSVTLIDVDEAQGSANSFTFDPVGISVGSERIVYDLGQQAKWGDLRIVSVVNPAIGALAGNISLTQTLIDSVVNRPSSPYVTGLAYQDAEKPCGVGAWGRATGGTADSNGQFTVNGDILRSDVSASYYGMQAGSDLACFDDRHAGWNLAFGVLAGVNHGDATQPVFTTLQGNARLTSLNKTEFTQAYGGVYMTATKDRWQADLQVRGERTDFTVSNRSLVGGVGLGLTDADFKSTSRTVSGSVGYVVPMGDSGWTVVPTGGFAWSSIRTDDLRFDIIQEGITETLEFEDAERAIGFAGATVARSYLQPGQDSALHVFATGTVYRDFADPAVSVFTRTGDDQMEPQRIVSGNLGTYGELSVGANFIRILGEGARARQFSTSARIDARFGDSLDSVGVTGQVRWQF